MIPQSKKHSQCKCKEHTYLWYSLEEAGSCAGASSLITFDLPAVVQPGRPFWAWQLHSTGTWPSKEVGSGALPQFPQA